MPDPSFARARAARQPAFLHALLAGVAFAALTTPRLLAQCPPPAGYYNSIDTSTAATLRATLHARIENHTRITTGQTWSVLESADENPSNPNQILDLYKNAAYAKVGGGSGPYNREHTWPKSYGFAVAGSNNYPDTDCHMLFLSDASYNSTRSNKPYKNCDASCNELVTLSNGGAGGGAGSFPGNSNWESGFGPFGGWQTWISRRGDVARALLYMDVRYDGSPHSTGSAEPDLILTDDQLAIDASENGSANQSVAYMGFLSVLLQWHQQDPPDARECQRNNVVFAAQGNRNPFIDHPEWAYSLWRRNGEDLRRPWINELHYDNAGTDQGEMVEIAGPAGLDLAGYRVAGYNGSNGTVYQNAHLSGTIPGQPGCVGTLAVDFVSMQNGAPDGLALVDPRNRVIEFLSYEGTFPALSGPAIGMTSVDIGVAESSSTPIGHSLQLAGTGGQRADFFWQTAQPNTKAQPNPSQVFTGGCGVPLRYGCGVNPFASMTLLAGMPSIGTSVTLGLDNPLATQAPGSPAFLFLAPTAAPGFPCGIALPGFGMRGPGAAGELLIGINGIVTLAAPPWTGPGMPAAVTLAIPPNVTLVGGTLFAQGVIFDAAASQGVRVGLTDAMQLNLDI